MDHGSNVSFRIITLLEDNTGENLNGLGCAMTFATPPEACFMGGMIGKLDFIKTENACSVRGNVKGMERQATYWAGSKGKDCKRHIS